MPDILASLRKYARGEINENVLGADLANDDITDLENDDEFMADVLEECVGMILSMEILGESAQLMDEATQEAFQKVTEYLSAQGVISEAAGNRANMRNPKVTYIRMSLKDQLLRLKSIIVLKIARKKGDPAYKKFKIGQKIKKENKAKMDAKYGTQAEKLARRMVQSMRKRGKVNAIVDDAQKKAGTKKAA